MSKGAAVIYILVGILFLAVLGGAYYFAAGKNIVSVPFKKSPVACIQEAKQCPDGSFVGREGPNCEFKPCPVSTSTPFPDETANWKIYINKTLSFRYPSDWEEDAPYVSGSQTIVQFKYQLTTTLTLSEILVNEKTGKKYTSLNEYIGTRMDISKDAVINGYPAKRITATTISPELSGHVIPYEEIVVFKPDETAIINLHYEKDYYDKPDSDKILDQILSTFKFLPATAGRDQK